MTALESKIEVTRGLYEFASAFRRQKRRPEVAAAAAEWEIRLKSEVEALERDLSRVKTPELALAGHHEEAA